MICLKPLHIVNPKYKNKSNPLEYLSFPDYFIDVPCGLCYACFKTWQSQWRVRLLNEFKYLSLPQKKRSVFITLTLEDKYIKKAQKDFAPFVKSFRDEFRRKYKRSCRFWFVREYGDTTNRLHYHGLIFDFPGNRFDLSSLWKFGTTNIKSLYVDEKNNGVRRVSYITKYSTKGMSKKMFYSKDEKPKCYCSPGIGKAYVDDPVNISFLRPFNGKFNMLTNGLDAKYSLPRYYKEKMLTTKEKVILHVDRLLSPVVKPPYRLGNLEFNNLSNFIKMLREDYNVISPLILRLYESE